jgi:hypothetical protein
VAAAVARGLHVTQDPHARAWLISSDATITHALKESFHRAERRALRLHRCNILGAMRTSTTHVLRSMYTTLITVILSPAHTGVLTMIHSMWIFGSYIGSGLLAAQYVLAKSGSSSLRTLQWGDRSVHQDTQTLRHSPTQTLIENCFVVRSQLLFFVHVVV